MSGGPAINPSAAGPGTVANVQTDVTAIRAVTDQIPDNGAMTSIAQAAATALQATLLAVQAAVAALQATVDDIEEEVEEIDQHVHNVERWWGSNGAATETNAIAATVTVPFQATSGNDDWGVAIPICGTADNPVLVGMATFDPHRLLVTDLDDDTDPWRIRIIWGTGTSGAAIAAGQWTEAMVITNTVPGNRAGGDPVDIRMPPIALGTKMWAQVWNNTNGEVLEFFWGAHGYPYPP